MEPFSLIALATAAGFVFRKMSGEDSGAGKERRYGLLRRRSKITPGHLQKTGSGVDLDEIEELEEYRFIKQLVDAEYPVIFVTGGAGTGKSTFVNWLMHHYAGNVLLAAPTAIAATNIDGKTIHSLFQLPLQWITRKSIKSTPNRVDIQKARLLIIDEISMVNANLLDGVSSFLRKNRNMDKPFGGLPVVMVGDLFQLPPIVQQGLMDFYDKYYSGQTKFYGARSLTETGVAYYAVELTRTFRQAEARFVNVLADIREGRNLEAALEVINSTCRITAIPPEGAVWLAPRRAEVDQANRAAMLRLLVRTFRYEGKMDGDYPANLDNLPSPMTLYLKVGAQVMFTRNDPKKRWVNGSVGTVRDLDDDRIMVEVKPGGRVVEVDRARWSNFRYRWNSRAGTIEKHETGIYMQFPLVLAWAITIHKSQGKTIEKVHLDLGRGAFAYGQTYVALSRCRELGGLSLSRKLTIADIRVDQDSQVFNDHLHDLMERLPPKKMLEAITGMSPSAPGTIKISS